MSRPEKTEEEFVKHFWLNVKKTSGCWEWQGLLDGRGYGAVWRQGKKHRTHRISYTFKNGDIPKGILVCHHCDNKICVRPSHLFLGTHKDNMQDWTRKGKNYLVNHPEINLGKNNWLARNTKAAKAERKKISKRRKQEWASGRRIPIRDQRGRIMGTRMIQV